MKDQQSQFVSRGNSEGYFAFQWSNEAADFLRKNRFKKLVFAGAWGDFGFISEYADFIESLDFQNEDRDATGIASLHELKNLTLGGKPKKPIDFTKLKKLESCTLPWDKSYSRTLFSLPKIRDVTIESFGEIDFNDVSWNPSLEKLTLTKPNIESLNGIGGCENLQELDISYASKLAHVEDIGNLRKLVKLRIINAKKICSFPSIAMLNELEVLILGNVSLTSLDFVGSSPKLRTLSVGGEPVHVDWTRLLKLPNLTLLQVLTNKETCPSEQDFKVLLSSLGRHAESIGLTTTPKSSWVSVQIRCSSSDLN